MTRLFHELPDHSRLWVYQASRNLNDTEVALIEKEFSEFSAGWAAHGKPLRNDFMVAYNRFVIVAVDEGQANASGCSIDSSVAVLKKLETELELSLFDRMRIVYKENGALKDASMNEFKELLKTGELSARTIVFNNMITSKGEWEQSWEVAVQESWHKRFL